MKRGIFDKAVVKLTLIYTGILAVICLGFSMTFWMTTDNELNRPFQPKHEMIRTEISEDNISIILKQRNEQTRAGLALNLIVINVTVLALGAIVSYFLARWTLDPIQKNTEQQAQFISNASHELRTPLTAITMENEVALRDSTMTKADLLKVVESNLEETKKLQKLTNYLLNLDQKEEIQISEVDISPAVKLAVERNQALTDAKNIKIENNIKSRKMKTNNDVMENILAIIIDNAVKYSPENTTIKIGIKENKIFVSDEGQGISDEDMPHIFDRFYRAEKSRTSEGYGLGLSLAKQQAESLGMTITAENNNKGKGVTFYIG